MMSDKVIILIERKSNAVDRFLEALAEEGFLSFQETRKRFPNTTAHQTIQNFMFKINHSLQLLFSQSPLFRLEIIEENNKVMKAYVLHKGTNLETMKHHYLLTIDHGIENTQDNI